MTLYTPKAFAVDERAEAEALIHANAFATLITGVDGDEPRVSHVPLLLEDGALFGHVARPNPHWQAFGRGRTLAVFHGPHAFVSPHWYETPEDNVPTWNYAVVHVHGRPELLDERGAQRVVEQLSARFDGGEPVTRMEKLQRLLPGIVAFRMPIERIDAKFKMSQNKSAADRAGVIAALAASVRDEERAVADWMRSREG